ncbi:MAG: hypothetical protein GWO20_11355 [Candidatus Korarchaeota archaeon]|nr:hypothetical protein [Candidatus Korarchaeota archaeon]NIU82914.1 hypothetical protein [Candidatus Thorarchaeota archaeon]NIW14180.1 hypothetical protein [Candidatus Thorarchaeota archaeon]NIW52288.1 hypothetical protein [Candidatus Korarchaeota archaeon]
MPWKRNTILSSQILSSYEQVKGKLEGKKKRTKNVLLKGVIGKEKWSLERLKTDAFSALDRLLTTDFSQFPTLNALFLFLEECNQDVKTLRQRYEDSLQPYHSNVKEKVKKLENEARIDSLRGRIYFPQSLKTKLEEFDKMPLIHYLQSKLRAQHLFYLGLSGILLVRQYVLQASKQVSYKAREKYKNELQENHHLQVVLRQLRHQMTKDEKLVSTMVKLEKQEEEDTYTFKRKEKDDWEEREF